MGTLEAVLLSANSGHPPTSRHGIAVEPQGPQSLSRVLILRAEPGRLGSLRRAGLLPHNPFWGIKTSFIMHFENPLLGQTVMIMKFPEESSDTVHDPKTH